MPICRKVAIFPLKIETNVYTNVHLLCKHLCYTDRIYIVGTRLALRWGKDDSAQSAPIAPPQLQNLQHVVQFTGGISK